MRRSLLSSFCARCVLPEAPRAAAPLDNTHAGPALEAMRRRLAAHPGVLGAPPHASPDTLAARRSNETSALSKRVSPATAEALLDLALAHRAAPGDAASGGSRALLMKTMAVLRAAPDLCTHSRGGSTTRAGVLEHFERAEKGQEEPSSEDSEVEGTLPER